MNDGEVLLLRGDFPLDCTGFVTDILSHRVLAVNLRQRKGPAVWLQTLPSTVVSSYTHRPPDSDPVFPPDSDPVFPIHSLEEAFI